MIGPSTLVSTYLPLQLTRSDRISLTLYTVLEPKQAYSSHNIAAYARYMSVKRAFTGSGYRLPGVSEHHSPFLFSWLAKFKEQVIYRLRTDYIQAGIQGVKCKKRVRGPRRQRVPSQTLQDGARVRAVSRRQTLLRRPISVALSAVSELAAAGTPPCRVPGPGVPENPSISSSFCNRTRWA